MGSKYPVLKSAEVVKVLGKLGFVFKSQKGSHSKYVKVLDGEPKRTVIVPMHDEIAKGTLQSILEQSGLTLDEFLVEL